jgi:hypothetical protein
MFDFNPHQWCQVNQWTELRQLENGLWVAFPPGGFIETPLPNQVIQGETSGKFSLRKHQIDAVLLILSVLFVGTIAIIISPCFILPFRKKVRY